MSIITNPPGLLQVGVIHRNVERAIEWQLDLERARMAPAHPLGSRPVVSGTADLSDGPPLTLVGHWRIYFNRHGADSLAWCVAPESGAWEIAVRSVTVSTPARTVYAPKATPDDEDGKPSAWFSVGGRLEVGADGHAAIGARKPEPHHPPKESVRERDPERWHAFLVRHVTEERAALERQLAEIESRRSDGHATIGEP
jgi:hypothetical protein